MAERAWRPPWLFQPTGPISYLPFRRTPARRPGTLQRLASPLLQLPSSQKSCHAAEWRAKGRFGAVRLDPDQT